MKVNTEKWDLVPCTGILETCVTCMSQTSLVTLHFFCQPQKFSRTIVVPWSAILRPIGKFSENIIVKSSMIYVQIARYSSYTQLLIVSIAYRGTYIICVGQSHFTKFSFRGKFSWVEMALYAACNRPLAHDVIAPVTMHLEDKLAIYA
jgi:hypothetical protein